MCHEVVICGNDRLWYDQALPEDLFETYVVADKIDEVGLKPFPNGYSINGALDNDSLFTRRSGRHPSDVVAESIFAELRELIGRYSTDQPGSVTITLNGTEWVQQ